MNRCIIICAYCEGKIRDAVKLQEDDFIICADGGLDLALSENIKPNLYVGDKDSTYKSYDCEQIVLPAQKDDTDTMAALKIALKRGFHECVIVGGIGGRLDQTLANIQVLAYALKNDMHAQLRDANNRVFLLKSASESITYKKGFYLSVLAYSPVCRGVSVSEVEYPLENTVITANYPLGVSNRITGNRAVVSVSDGTLLIIQSRDRLPDADPQQA